MKIRTGFVSNSSSSSFIVACKKDLFDVSDDTLNDVFKISKDSPIYKICSILMDCIRDNSTEITDFIEYVKDRYGNDLDYLDYDDNKKIMKLLNSGWKVYSGEFSDESGGVEGLLCNMDLNFEDENFVIIHEAGY